jgi:hypothetical protein
MVTTASATIAQESNAMCELWRLAIIITVMLPWQPLAAAEQPQGPRQQGDISIVQAFAEDKVEEGQAVKISEKRKHFWLFIMGLTLLILILLTAAMGIMMGIYGKDVFVAHMVLAGLTVTLAIAHAIAAIVWFNPF